MDKMRRKICDRCGEEKDAWEFNISAKAWDGLTGQCKACIKKTYHERVRKNYPPKSKDYNYPPL